MIMGPLPTYISLGFIILLQFDHAYVAVAHRGCETGWDLVGSQCIKLVKQNRNGADAKKYCESLSNGATLVQPDDIFHLHEQMKNRNELVGRSNYAWYVGAEMVYPGIMTWYTRGRVPTRYQDKPAAGTDDCVVLTWSDRDTPFLKSVSCNTRQWSICDKNAEKQTVPRATVYSRCNINNGGCSQGCQLISNRVQCFCHQGFYLNDDGVSCRDIDECARNNGGCYQFCQNTYGSFRCGCQQGYKLVGGNRCQDISHVYNKVVFWPEFDD